MKLSTFCSYYSEYRQAQNASAEPDRAVDDDNGANSLLSLARAAAASGVVAHNMAVAGQPVLGAIPGGTPVAASSVQAATVAAPASVHQAPPVALPSSVQARPAASLFAFDRRVGRPPVLYGALLDEFSRRVRRLEERNHLFGWNIVASEAIDTILSDPSMTMSEKLAAIMRVCIQSLSLLLVCLYCLYYCRID